MKKETTYVRTLLNRKSDTCVIFDCDDTLMRHAKHGGYNDLSDLEPIGPIVELAHMVAAHGYDIVVATARPAESLPETVAWLKKHVPQYAGVYLRSDVTSATASAAKQDMLADIENHWDVAFAVDDSPWNARMFEDNGVTCLRPMTNEAYWAAVGDS